MIVTISWQGNDVDNNALNQLKRVLYKIYISSSIINSRDVMNWYVSLAEKQKKTKQSIKTCHKHEFIWVDNYEVLT